MPLTDNAIRNAKPGEKPVKLADEKGLFLLIAPAGGKWWRLKYRFGGKEKLLSLGIYPETGLKDAREKRDQARKALAQGIDPGEQRKAMKTAQTAETDTFEVVAREWFAKYQPTWATTHADKIISRLEKDAFPWLGKRPIREINAPEILTVLRRIEARGALDTAHRVHQNCGQIFRYAVATGRTDRDPCGDLRGALPPDKREHFAALTDPADVAELLRAIDGFRGTFVVQCALKLAPLFFVRPGELRQAEWKDFDLDAAEWRYTVSKTKTEHLVPLSRQAVAILRELHALTGNGPHVFPGRDPKKAMSEAAVNAALKRMGYDTKTQITGHGFRAMARTMLHQDKALGFAPEVIEHQLAHRVLDALGSAYNRTKFIDERRRMMQAWADHLEGLKSGAQVILLKRAK
ncbi:MAG: tyrosine-type recombinase/integrase [Candidatus Methylumidiphilus sp.]